MTEYEEKKEVRHSLFLLDDYADRFREFMHATEKSDFRDYYFTASEMQSASARFEECVMWIRIFLTRD